MARELAISAYLLLFSFLFRIAKLFPQQKKIVFCVSFAENNLYLYNELKTQQADIPCVFLTEKRTFSYFIEHQKQTDTVLLFSPIKFLTFLIGIYHLATAKIIVVDNYYGYLSTIRFKRNVKCLQIWHAAGAIKQFGRKDPSIKTRTAAARTRFQKVYKQFHYISTGSDKMSTIFQEAFGANKDQMLPLGIPRTDLFFQKDTKNKVQQQIYAAYPNFQHKKVILYAPTYRDGEKNYTLPLDLSLMKASLQEEYILILKLHPHITNTLHFDTYKDFVYDLTNYPNINELLLVTDYLITDYSSIPFEFSFLEKPMIFFPYDLDEYKKSRGFWEDYEELVPGPIVSNTAEIIDIIKSQSVNTEKTNRFHQEWNEYSVGCSSYKTAHLLLEWVKKD
ncbi:CDP-glycerol glycerophosphotransferase family protein [Niallia sp. 03091]|uniref:CDP-glycerol glycerophosphotransferase family protein n=1 Tax=unclassified Niallia TaxID=2837522 RepID=UPI004044A6D1